MYVGAKNESGESMTHTMHGTQRLVNITAVSQIDSLKGQINHKQSIK